MLTDLRLELPDGSSAEILPDPIPDLYSGEPLVAVMRIKNLPANVTVSGRAGSVDWQEQIALSQNQNGSRAGINVLWARKKIERLTDMRNNSRGVVNREQLRDQILQVALKHHLVSAFTSLVAVDLTPARPMGDALSKHKIPNNAPKGTRFGLPQTATPATLYAVLGVVLLLPALFMFKRWPLVFGRVSYVLPQAQPRCLVSRLGFYRWLVSLGVAAIGLALLGNAASIHAKALLGQFLIRDAWQKTLELGGRAAHQGIKPWSWADTWPVARLQVPALNVDQIVLAGDSGQALAFGPGHHSGSALPGGPGLTIISGHRDTHFQFVLDLQAGDSFILQSSQGAVFHYQVTDVQIIDIRKTDVIYSYNLHKVVLVTCWSESNYTSSTPYRYLVWGEQNEVESHG